MDNPSTPMPDPYSTGVSPMPGEGPQGVESGSEGDFVLGYPDTKPAKIDLGPVPSGVGAKPSAKSAAAPRKGSSGSSKPSGKPKPVQRSGPPLPKRPKGRLFVGSTFLLVLVGFSYSVFNSMLRYSAYGEVTGRRIELAVPWPGVVQSLHVREGDEVRFGDLIARIDSLEMRQKIEAIDDSLRLERARLASELAMLRWEAEKIRDNRKLSISDFYDKWSELLWQQSRLADLRMQVKRLEPIYREGAASEEKLESLRFQLAGQEKRVEQLTEAVRALKQRSDETPFELSLEDRVKPTLARIENLQSELQRTRELIRQGEIRAPATGRIVRTFRFVGEFADQTTPVAELLVEGSTEMVLYLPQSEAHRFPVGRSLELHVSPIRSQLVCRVDRIAMETRSAPESLAKYYRTNESLLPVYLRIEDQQRVLTSLALGSEIRLPRSQEISPLSRLQSWWRGDADASSRRDALQPPEMSSPDRMVQHRRHPSEDADIEEEGRDGRMAGWRQP